MPDDRVYQRGWGWDVFAGVEGLHIERMDENCWPAGDPNYMTDETAEWLVLLLAADDDGEAQEALAEAEYAHA